MDPLSAAGLGFGAFQLLVQLFSGCLKSYQLYIDMEEFPKEQEYIRLRIRIERYRFLEWGDKVGLLDGEQKTKEPRDKLNQSVTADMLLGIQYVFKKCLKVERKVPVVKSQPPDETNSESTANGAQGETEPRRQKLLKKAIAVVEQSNEITTKLKWAMIQKDRLKGLVSELIKYNDSIVSLLDSVSIDELYKMQVQSHLTLLQLNHKIDEINVLSKALRIQQHGTHHSPADSQSLSPGFARIAEFKAKFTSLELKLPPVDFKIMHENDEDYIKVGQTRKRVEYDDKEVWIEWKYYDVRHPKPNWQDEIEERVQGLVSLLMQSPKPEEFRVPQCLGYIQEKNETTGRFGLIYEMPLESTPETRTVSLLEMFSQMEMPSLTRRVRLGHAIAKSLMYLHAVNWLHKGLRSDNILQFLDQDSVPDYGAPMISGFEYSRPDLPDAMTEDTVPEFASDVYRHPSALSSHKQSRSKKSWDIYSLGIVLTEIAFWKPINDKLGIHCNMRDVQKRIRGIRVNLLKPGFLAEISRVTGGRYARVVQTCIEGGSKLGLSEGVDEADPEVGAELLRTFSDEVVDVLGSISL